MLKILPSRFVVVRGNIPIRVQVTNVSGYLSVTEVPMYAKILYQHAALFLHIDVAKSQASSAHGALQGWKTCFGKVCSWDKY